MWLEVTRGEALTAALCYTGAAEVTRRLTIREGGQPGRRVSSGQVQCRTRVYRQERSGQAEKINTGGYVSS